MRFRPPSSPTICMMIGAHRETESGRGTSRRRAMGSSIGCEQRARTLLDVMLTKNDFHGGQPDSGSFQTFLFQNGLLEKGCAMCGCILTHNGAGTLARVSFHTTRFINRDLAVREFASTNSSCTKEGAVSPGGGTRSATETT